MTNEISPMAPSEQEPHSTQPHQSTPGIVPQDTQQAMQPVIQRIVSQVPQNPNPQNVTNLTAVPSAGLVTVSSNVKEDFLVLTPNGPEPLMTRIHKAYSGPLAHLYPWDEIGISRLFADTFSYILRYVTERKKWYMFNGKFWASNDAKAMELCKLLVKSVYEYSVNILPLLAKKQQSFMKNLTPRYVRENILKDAASVNPIKMSDFDKDPMLFNCENGTIDLNTGVLRPHNPDDLITKVANVDYDPNARCDRWIQHIDEVMEGDAGKAGFLQKALSTCLAGENRYECFYILFGPTSRNGKSTTMETIMKMMGDYGRAARPETHAWAEDGTRDPATGRRCGLARGAAPRAVPCRMG